MTNEVENEFTPEEWERIRAHLRARGMTFEVFLPERSAEWARAGLASGNVPSHQHPPRRIARHRTGRNQQLNIKATAETIERFYKLADQRRVALGELLEQALDALEKSAE